MNRKLPQLLQPSLQLYFVCLVLFALVSALISWPLAVLELVKARRVIVDGLPGQETVQMRGTKETWRSERSREP